MMLLSCRRICMPEMLAAVKGCAARRELSAKASLKYSSDIPELGYMKLDNVRLHWGRTGWGPHVLLGFPGLVGSYGQNILPVFKKMDPESFTMIGWDPPGYGKSRPPDREILNTEIDALRKDAHLAARLMEELGYERYSLVGQSGGGRTAALLASFYPERVIKLVMYSAPKYSDDHMVQVAKMFKDLNSWTPAQRKRLKRMYEPLYLNKMLEDFEEYMRRERDTHREADIFDDDLKKITAKTLVMYGGRDQVCLPRHAQEFHSVIPNSRLYEVKDGAHDHLEVLDEFVTVTSAFLLDEP